MDGWMNSQFDIATGTWCNTGLHTGALSRPTCHSSITVEGRNFPG